MLQINEVKSTLEKELFRWGIPGCALSIVKDGEVVYSGGVGSRDEDGHPVTGQSLTQIASCTKAFTATLAGVLATEGLLDFDTPVVNYMPDFRMNDDYATSHLTVRDFLCHRSGLPRHELAWYGTGFSRETLMSNIKYLPLNAPIRYRFQYSNFNYLIVGSLIERITGMSFEEALKTKLLEPLGMISSQVYLDKVESREDHMLPFGRDPEFSMNGTKRIPYYCSPAEVHCDDETQRVGDPTASAGCIVSNADDMTKWLKFNLNRGKVGDKQLVSEEIMDLIHSIHLFMGSDPGTLPEQTDMFYAQGWFVYHYRNMKMVEHGGNINGFTSSVAFVPELNLGIFISVNMNGTLFADALSRNLIDRVIDAPDAKWFDRQYEMNREMLEGTKAFYSSMGGDGVPGTTPTHQLVDFTGTYEAPGYRRFVITYEGDHLQADFNSSVTALRHHNYDTFATAEKMCELPAGMLLNFGVTPKGDVKTLSVLLGFEENLQPIVFTKI